MSRGPVTKLNIGRDRPWWAIAGLAAIAALTLALYVWSLSRNGMANSYYAAAVKSASLSWKAFLFGSLDPGSFITVDKPPASIWLMALSARIFGFSSWSMLVPQALAGLGSVLVLHHLVRRWAGEAAALLAALAFALTPVAVLVFRYNNPDALLTLLLLLSAWALWRALETGSTWKLGLAGVVLGFAFLTKMLMAFLVVPAFIVVYLVCGRGRVARRLGQLVAPIAGIALVSGAWLATVSLWPDSSRPYVGGTTGNSWFDLILGRTGGYLGGTSPTGQMSGDPGPFRIFNTALGGQVSWLLALALAGLVAGLWATRGARRTDKVRAGYLLWGLWTLVMIAVFAFVQGTFHSYYTVALAPGVAALAGAGSVELWRIGVKRRAWSWLLPVVIAGSAVWSAVLLGRVSGYAPGLGVAVIVVGVAGAAALLASIWWRPRGRMRRVSMAAIAVVCLAALLAGPFAYDLSTVSRSVTGNAAAAGPGAARLGSASAGLATPGQSLTTTSTANAAAVGDSTTTTASDLMVDASLLAYLEQNRQGAKYLVAVQTSTASVPIILATGEPVVTIGGYKSRDPVPTSAQLEALVASGDLRYVLLTDDGTSSSSGEGTESTKAILQATVDWVLEHGTVVSASEHGGTAAGTLYLVE